MRRWLSQDLSVKKGEVELMESYSIFINGDFHQRRAVDNRCVAGVNSFQDHFS